MSFFIGDRVNTRYGIGTIIGYDHLNSLLVEHDEYMGGHAGSSVVEGRSGAMGHCWFFNDSDLKKIEKEVVRF